MRRNGCLYVYVYGENGFHASPQFNMVRKTFHALATFEERIAFAERTLPAATLPGTNIKNLLGWYDALCPFYNWTIPLEVVARWYRDHAFRNITLLNRSEVFGNNDCGYHVLGALGATDKPVFDAELEEILAAREANRRRCKAQEAEDNLKLEKYRKGRPLPLKGFRREVGNCYTVALPGGAELKRLFLYENETPLLPGDALHDTIRTDGKGSYSVWPAGKQCALYMSTSDNTDPNRNGRTYSLRYATPGGYSPAPRRLRWPSDAEAAGRKRTAHAFQYRDGLVYCFPRAHTTAPPHARALRIGKHLVKIHDLWALDIPAADTKARRALDYPIPSDMSERIDFYLEHLRKHIPGAHKHTSLWASNEGCPMCGMAIYAAVRRRTKKAFGFAVNLHRFRHAAASFWSSHDPVNVRGAKDLLGHASFDQTEKHYIIGQSRLAGRALAHAIDTLRK